MLSSSIQKNNLDYSFSDTHPFNQKRIVLTLDLLKSAGAITDADIIAPRIATDDELILAHDAKFIDIVKRAGKGEINRSNGEMYGIGTEDTPIFPNMHEASAMLVGGTLTAVDEVMSRTCPTRPQLGRWTSPRL